MRPLDLQLARSLILRFAAPLPTQTVAEWCVERVIFDEPEIKGPMNLTGRRYLVALLNDNNDPTVSRQSLCFGTGLGKTISYMAAMAWKMIHKMPRCLWVMPSEKGANGTANFSNSRMIRMLKATPAIAARFPKNRHAVNGSKIHMNGTVIDFSGANSAGQLTGNRCSDVRCDETDKFPKKLGNEAGALHQAITRTDGVIGAQVFDSSSPSVEEGAIWQSLRASNLQRRFIPCPHCGRNHPSSKNFVIIWNPQYSILPDKLPDGTAIPLASIRWDKEARRADGSWDIDRVVSSARAECPHCGGHVLDSDMVWCDENGVWIPTKRGPSANKHQGYHLPSMYAPRRDFNSTFGGLAKKFIEAKESADGMRGFINSVLAEPDSSQEQSQSAISIVSRPAAENAQQWLPILTTDVQQNWPYFWFIVRRWLAWVITPKLEDEPRVAALAQLKESRHEMLKYFDADTLLEMQRLPRWEPLATAMIAGGLSGDTAAKKLSEFNGDTLRALEWLGKEFNQPISKQGDSEAIHIGHCDDWRDIADIQSQHGVQNIDVIADSGWGATDNAEVYAECFLKMTEHCFYSPLSKSFSSYQVAGSLPFALNGWRPAKGFPADKRWRDANRVTQPYAMHADDPFKGKAEAGAAFHFVFQFSKQYFLEELSRIRAKKTHVWGVAENCILTGEQMGENLDHYKKHLAGKFKDRDGKWQEKKLDHLYDCENIQIAYSTFRGLFNYQKPVSNFRPEKGESK